MFKGEIIQPAQVCFGEIGRLPRILGGKDAIELENIIFIHMDNDIYQEKQNIHFFHFPAAVSEKFQMCKR